MGACASVPKAMRAEATNVPAPEPREEETSATIAVKETTVTTVDKAAEGGDDNSQKKAAKVEAPKETAEVVSNESKIEAPTPPPKPSVAQLEEEKKTLAAEHMN